MDKHFTSASCITIYACASKLIWSVFLPLMSPDTNLTFVCALCTFILSIYLNDLKNLQTLTVGFVVTKRTQIQKSVSFLDNA